MVRFRYVAKSVSVGNRAFQISGQRVVQPGHVGGALNIRMAAQRVYAAARSPNVAEKKLNHGRRADDLRSESMLRPAHRVDDGRDFLHVAVFADGGKQIDGLQVLVLRDARDALDGFGGVARILLLHQLENAARMLERQVVGDIRRQRGRRRGRRSADLRCRARGCGRCVRSEAAAASVLPLKSPPSS